MPQRLVKETVILQRPGEGKDAKPVRITPEIGKNFNFTAEEIADIESVRKEALGKAVAKEDGDDDDAAATKTAEKTATATKTTKEDEL